MLRKTQRESETEDSKSAVFLILRFGDSSKDSVPKIQQQTPSFHIDRGLGSHSGIF